MTNISEEGNCVRDLQGPTLPKPYVPPPWGGIPQEDYMTRR